jgi:hypothetical protein
MWLLGHSAAAYLAIKIFCVVFNIIADKKVDPKLGKSNKLKKSKRYLFPPYFLILLFVFANWPDFIHIGNLRMISHNIIAIILVPIIIVGLLIFRNLINKTEAFLLILVSILHGLTDTLVSGFQAFLPFTDIYFRVFVFNSIEDVIFESIIGFIFLIVLIQSGDLIKLKDFLIQSKKKMNDATKIDFISFWNVIIYQFLFFGFSLFAFMQLLLFAMWSLRSIQNLHWTYFIFFMVFLGFIIILLEVFYKYLFTPKYNKK